MRLIGFIHKTLPLTGLFILGTFQLSAQSLEWIKQRNGDAVYASTLVGTDLFVAHDDGGSAQVNRIDSSGTVLARFINAINIDIQAITVGSNNDVYIAGYFSGTRDFNPDLSALAAHISQGSRDAFVARYDQMTSSPSGMGSIDSLAFRWVRVFGNTADDYIVDMELLGDTLYMFGTYEGSVDFDGGPGTAISVSNSTTGGEAFLLTYDTAGTYLNNFPFVTSGLPSESSSESMSMDPNGDIYVAIDWVGTLNYDGTNTLTSSTGNNTMVGAYTQGGGGAVTNLWQDHYLHMEYKSLEAGASQLYVIGTVELNQTLDLDPSGASSNITSTGRNTGYVAKYSLGGTFRAGGELEGEWANGRAHHLITSSNELFIVGGFIDTVDFDPGAGAEIHVSTYQGAVPTMDIFLAKYDTSLALQYVWTTGATGSENADDIQVLSDGDILLMGNFDVATDFDFSAVDSTRNPGLSADVFLASYDTLAPCLLNASIASSTGALNFCLGDTIDLIATGFTGATSITWKRNSSLIAGASNDTLVVDSGGVYRVIMVDNVNCADSAAVTVTAIAPPLVGLNIPASKNDLCANATNFFLNDETPSGGQYTFPGFSGGAGQNPQVAPQILGAGLYPVSYTYTHPGTGCSASDYDTIRIYAIPTVSLSALIPVCSNDTIVNLMPFANISGGIFTGTGVFSDSLFDPASAGSSPRVITYTYTDSNNCTASDQENQTVLPAPNVFFTTPIFPDVCEGSGVFDISSQVSPPTSTTGATFLFKGVGIVSAGGDFDPDSSIIGGTDTLRYIYTDANGCTDSSSATIRVHARPVVSLTLPDTILCVNQGVTTLSGGVPLGGLYFSNKGTVINGKYVPTIAGPGFDTIYYRFEDINQCKNVAFDILEVKPEPVVNTGAFPAICSNADTMLLTQGSPLGGTWTGKGVVMGNVFDPNQFGVSIGFNQLVYFYTDTFGCGSSDTGFILVNPAPTVSFNLEENLCEDEDVFGLSTDPRVWVDPLGGSFFGEGLMSGDSIDPGSLILDSLYEVSYVYTDGLGCSDTVLAVYRVHEIPTITFSTDGKACNSLPARIGIEEDLLYDWSTGEDTKNIFVQISVPTTFYVTVNDFFCYNNDSITMEIAEQSIVIANQDSVAGPYNTDYREIDLISNDEGNVASIRVLTSPSNGTGGASPGLDDAIDYTPDFNFRHIDTMTYEVCDSICYNICDTGIVILNMLGDPKQFMPNAFTPDDNGINDLFIVPGVELYPENEFTVYNVNGDVVFRAKPYLNDWDGKAKGTAVPNIGGKVPDGTYYYVLKLDPEEDILTGYIDLKTR